MKKIFYPEKSVLPLFLLSLLPLFLPWFYFDSDVEGIIYGISFFENPIGISFVLITIIAILCYSFFGKTKIATYISLFLLVIYPFVYLYKFCTWYIRTIAEFNFFISFDGAHIGFYIGFLFSVFVSIIMLIPIIKAEKSTPI